MNDLIIKLAQANKDHYDNHPVAHIALMGAYAALAGSVYSKAFKKMTDPKKN